MSFFSMFYQSCLFIRFSAFPQFFMVDFRSLDHSEASLEYLIVLIYVLNSEASGARAGIVHEAFSTLQLFAFCAAIPIFLKWCAFVIPSKPNTAASSHAFSGRVPRFETLDSCSRPKFGSDIPFNVGCAIPWFVSPFEDFLSPA